MSRQEKESTIVWVAGLTRTVKEEHLREIFGEFGEVEEVEIGYLPFFLLPFFITQF